MQKIKSYWHEFKLWWREDRLIHSLYFVIGALMLCLLIVGLEIFGSEEITWFLGTGSEEGGKKETIKFIAFGIGGMLAIMGAVAVNRRAIAQIKNVEAQVENNRLTEKGHIDERFKSAAENLWNENRGARISSFYQFYYLAKDSQDDNLKENIFSILCAHLSSIICTESYKNGEGKSKPTEECQILLNVLFHRTKESIFYKQHAELPSAHLVRANLSHAHLWGMMFSGANLQRSDLSFAYLRFAYLSHADLSDATLTGAYLKDANLSFANFSNANLLNANLSDTDISDANLSDADISGANLSHTNLSGARLTNACLVRANFRGAKLKSEQLQNVLNFDGADFRDTGIKLADLPSDKGTPITDE